jgi:hypothetical protein
MRMVDQKAWVGECYDYVAQLMKYLDEYRDWNKHIIFPFLNQFDDKQGNEAETK